MKRGLSSPYQRDNPNGEKDEGYVLVNQPYKQTKSKLQVTIKISSSK